MSEYYTKSSRGRQALRERSHALPRSTRNLLLILDASRPVRHWLAMVRGADWSDVAVLTRAGFIEAVAAPGAPETRPLLGSDLQADFRPSDFHLSMVTADDDLALLERRPVVAAPRPVAAPVRPLPARPVVARDAEEIDSGFMPLDRLAPAVAPAAGAAPLGYADLYDSLNALVRQSLGLFAGYRYALRIERARDVIELRRVAQDFIREVHRRHGGSVGRVVQRALGL